MTPFDGGTVNEDDTPDRLQATPVDPEHPEQEVLVRAAEALREGRLVAFPTETVYGLGADATNPDAVKRIFAAKGRPPDNPLIVHVPGSDGLEKVANEVPPLAKSLMERFWPGPLTLVLPAHPDLPRIVTAGLDTVAVRAPAHPVAFGLLAAARVPLAAPSANRSGRPSPTRAQHVLADFRDPAVVAMVLDAGRCTIGVESTVVDLTQDSPVVLRLGGVDPVKIKEVTERLKINPHARGAVVAPGTSVASPGMKHRHYAPRAIMELYEGPGATKRLLEAYAQAEVGERLGLLVTRECAQAHDLSGPHVAVYGSRDDPDECAQNLFDALRRLDSEKPGRILAEGIDEAGLGATVMDRLRRAARSTARSH